MNYREFADSHSATPQKLKEKSDQLERQDPDFSLQPDNGGTHRLSDRAGQRILLNTVSLLDGES